jgi:hypothetical protein
MNLRESKRATTPVNLQIKTNHNSRRCAILKNSKIEKLKGRVCVIIPNKTKNSF